MTEVTIKVMRRRALALAFAFASAFRFHAFAVDPIKAAVVKNTLNPIADESAIIEEAFGRFFKEKSVVDDAERGYYLGRARESEFAGINESLASAALSENDAEYAKALDRRRAFLDRADEVSAGGRAISAARDSAEMVLPVELAKITFDGFDLRALFQRSRILARFIVAKNKCDYLLIPASLPLENNLIRARLILYSRMTGDFTIIFDQVVSQSEFSGFFKDNMVGLFPFFLPEGMGALDFPVKDYGYEVFLNGEEVEDYSSFPEGELTLLVTSPGYEDATVTVDIRKNEINKLDFTLKEKVNKQIMFTSDGPMYEAFSSEKGLFRVPEFITDYKTPQSISFSHPGYSTRYMSLLGDTETINVSLKPNYLLDNSYAESEKRDFYRSALASIGIFAADIVCRSFLAAHPGSGFWQVAEKTASYAGYFSISLVLINLIDYFFSASYEFE